MSEPKPEWNAGPDAPPESAPWASSVVITPADDHFDETRIIARWREAIASAVATLSQAERTFADGDLLRVRGWMDIRDGRLVRVTARVEVVREDA